MYSHYTHILPALYSNSKLTVSPLYPLFTPIILSLYPTVSELYPSSPLFLYSTPVHITVPSLYTMYSHYTHILPSLYPNCKLTVSPLYPLFTPILLSLYPHCTSTILSLYPSSHAVQPLHITEPSLYINVPHCTFIAWPGGFAL